MGWLLAHRHELLIGGVALACVGFRGGAAPTSARRRRTLLLRRGTTTVEVTLPASAFRRPAIPTRFSRLALRRFNPTSPKPPRSVWILGPDGSIHHPLASTLPSALVEALDATPNGYLAPSHRWAGVAVSSAEVCPFQRHALSPSNRLNLLRRLRGGSSATSSSPPPTAPHPLSESSSSPPLSPVSASRDHWVRVRNR
jgi:hypothetical protein